MGVIDWFILIISVCLIGVVLLQESKDDINDAFSGERTDLFKNQKQRGFEAVLSKVTGVLSLILIVLVIISHHI